MPIDPVVVDEKLADMLNGRKLEEVLKKKLEIVARVDVLVNGDSKLTLNSNETNSACVIQI